ncbi:MAG: YVTN family beta-propeller protein [Marinoscillum sp.]|jgi:YVTN family beta-propeller protein
MNKHFNHFFISILIAGSAFFTSCQDEDPTPVTPQVGAEGYFIVNEGAWGAGNASLSFFDRNTGSVSNDLFYNANNKRALGDQAQSMAIHDTLGYIVVQNSGKIEVIDISNYKSVATIDEEIESPRYFIGYSATKGYVSDWGSDGVSGSVKVVDLTTFNVTKTISTGQGANQLLLDGDQLYVVNGGGWGRDNSLVIINTTTDEIAEEIEVGDNPNSLQIDAAGNIWVLTSGHSQYDENFALVEAESTKGALVKLDASGEVELTFPFESFSSPKGLKINKDGNTLYYNYSGAIYQMETTETILPTVAFVDKSFYGFAIDPFDGSIIGCEAPDFSTSGNMLIYSNAGVLTSTIKVGIAPNSCTFK